MHLYVCMYVYLYMYKYVRMYILTVCILSSSTRISLGLVLINTVPAPKLNE